MIGAGKRVIEREVLLNTTGTHCDRSDGDVNSERMIAEADRNLESFPHDLHGSTFASIECCSVHVDCARLRLSCCKGAAAWKAAS